MSVAEALSAPHPRHVATAPRTHHALPSVMSRPALVSQNHAFPFAGHGYFDDGNPPNTSSPVMAGYAHGPNSRELRDSLIAPQVMPFRLSSQQQAADLPGASANFAQAPHHTAIPANALPAPPGPGPGPPRQHRIAATRAITAPAFKQNYHPLRLRELQLYGSGEYGRMAANGAGAADFGPSEEELAQLQKLSAEYAPEVSVSVLPRCTLLYARVSALEWEIGTRC